MNSVSSNAVYQKYSGRYSQRQLNLDTSVIATGSIRLTTVGMFCTLDFANITFQPNLAYGDKRIIAADESIPASVAAPAAPSSIGFTIPPLNAAAPSQYFFLIGDSLYCGGGYQQQGEFYGSFMYARA